MWPPVNACLSRGGLLDDPVLLSDALRHCRARMQRTFHVADEGVAGVLTGEVQTADAVIERRALRRDLARSRERVRASRPGVRRPVHEAGANEARGDAAIYLV